MTKRLFLTILLFLCCFQPALAQIVRHVALFAVLACTWWALTSLLLHRWMNVPFALVACYMLFTISVYRKARKMEKGENQ